MVSKKHLSLFVTAVFYCYNCSSTDNISTQLDVELIPLDSCSVIFEDDLWVKKDSTKNYPNPFGPTTNLQFKVETDDSVKVYLVNSEGSKCWLALDKFLEAGNYTLNFKSLEKSGLYVAKIFFSDNVVTKKLLIVK